MDSPDVFKKAKGYALRLLKLRPHGSVELVRKIMHKGYDGVVAAKVAGELTALGLLDDPAFARAWIQSRLNRPMGFRRIRRELLEKGIPKDLVCAQWDELRENYDEFEIVRGLALKKARTCQGIDPLKRKKRVMDHLIRRGFQPDAVMKAIKDI